MDEKFTLKIIQNGQTQQAKVLRSGAGISGQAVVLNATDATRYQLVNVVTLASPQKLQLKRKGADLQMSLPGGDVDAPDLVIKDYFNATGVSLQGASISGEWMTYDTTSFAPVETNSIADNGDYTKQSFDKTSTASLASVGPSLGAILETPWGLAGLGLGVAAAAGGGGGGGGDAATSAVTTDPLEIVKSFASGGTTTAPTAANYTALGVTLPTLSGVAPEEIVKTLNAAIALKTSSDVATATQIIAVNAAMTSAYTSILAEANGTVADVTVSNPTLENYKSVGVAVANTSATLALMNSALGDMSSTNVDTLAKIKALATAAENVMLVTSSAVGAALTNADLLALGLKIDGVNSGITQVHADAFAANYLALETAIGKTESFVNGVAVNTIEKVQALLSMQVLRSFNDDVGSIGSKTQPAPGTSDYSNIGIKTYASLSDTSDVSRTTLNTVFTSAGLNSALDKLGTNLTKASIQTMVDSYYRILKEADGNTSINTDVYADMTNDSANATAFSDPTATDYANIGVKKADGISALGAGETLNLLNDAVGRFETTKVDTVEEIVVLEKAAENLIAMAAGSGAGTTALTGAGGYTADSEWIAGLTALGLTGLSTNNIAAVKAAIDTADSSNNGSAVNTVQELLDIIKPVIALQVLKEYTNNNGTTTVPTLSTYSDAGIKSYSSITATAALNRIALASSNTDISAINSALDKLAGSSLTLNTSSVPIGTIQKLVDSYYRILKEADGNTTLNTDVYADVTNDSANATAFNDPTAADYNNIGLTLVGGAVVVAGKVLDLLNDIVGRYDTTKVDTEAELTALLNASENIMTMAAGGFANGLVTLTNGYVTDEEWIAGFNAIGVTGITAGTLLAAVKKAIDTADNSNDGVAVNTIQELLDIVSPVIALQALKDYTDGATLTIPTLQTYTDAGIKSYNSLSDTLDTNRVAMTASNTTLGAINSAIDKFSGTQLTLNTAMANGTIQKLVDSYYRILKEADGNTSINTDVYADSANDPIGAGSDPTATDYANIGVTKADGTSALGAGETLNLLNDLVGRSSSSSVDTVEEIVVLEKAAENLIAMAAGSGNGLTALTGTGAYTTADEWIAGLTALGITGLNTANIASVKAALDTAETSIDGLAVNTVQELQDIAKPVIALQLLKDYTNSNASTTAPILQTYADAGIKSYNSLSDTLDTNRVAMTASNTTLGAINSAIDKISGAQLTLNTGIANGTIQKLVDSYYRILKEADGSTTTNTDVYADTTNDSVNAGLYNDPTATDFTNIGLLKADGITALAMIGDVNLLKLLNDVIGRTANSGVDTLAELSDIERAAENVIALASSAATTYTTDAQWIEGLSKLGVTGATVTNIGFIKSAIIAKDIGHDGALVNSVSQIQAVVSLERMKAFTTDTGAIGSKTAVAPTLADWGSLVKVNTSLSDATQIDLDTAAYWKNTNPGNGIAALNTAVDTYALGGTFVFDSASLKTIADSYGRVLQNADGSRLTATDVSLVIAGGTPKVTATDLTNIGVAFLGTGDQLTAEKILLADAIAGLSSAAVDSVSELNDLAKVVNNVVKQTSAAVTYSDAEWISALGSISITGVSLTNIAAIKTKILGTLGDSSKVDTYDELQGIVSLVRINDYANLNTGNVAPDLIDFQVAVQNAGGLYADVNTTTNYLGAYRDAVNYKQSNNFSASSDVRNMVVAYGRILAEANGAQADETAYDPLQVDYINIGVGTGTSADVAITGMLGIAESTNLLSDVVASKTVSQVSTVASLNTLASIVLKIHELEAKATLSTDYSIITGGTLQVSELTSLGLDTTNLTDNTKTSAALQNRLEDVYDHIIAIDNSTLVGRQTLDSLAELQALINNTSSIVV